MSLESQESALIGVCSAAATLQEQNDCAVVHNREASWASPHGDKGKASACGVRARLWLRSRIVPEDIVRNQA